MPKVYVDPTSKQEIEFSDDITSQEMELLVNKHFPPKSTSTFHAPDLSKLIPSELGGKGGDIKQAAESIRKGLPMAGGMAAGIPGAAAGSFASQALAPNPDIGQGVEDTITQGVVPEALGGLAGIFKSLRSNGLKQTIADLIPKSYGSKMAGTRAAEIINKAKGMLSSESQGVETLSANTQNRLPQQTTITQTTPAKTPAFQSTSTSTSQQMPPSYTGTVAEDLTNTPYTQKMVAKIPPLSKTADKMFSDISELRNAKIASGDPTTIRQLAQDRLLRKYGNFENGTFDPVKILNEIGENNDIYKEALGGSYNNFKSLMEEAHKLKIGAAPDSLVTLKKAGKLGSIALASNLFGLPYSATTAIVLSAGALQKIAASPEIGQLIIAGMKTPRSNPASSLLGKAIAQGLRGTTLFLTDTDGKKQEVQVGEDGQLQTPPPGPK